MSGGIYAALSGAMAQEASLECTAQNLANAATGGFRGVRPVFHEVLSQAQGTRFTAMTGTTLDLSPGEMRETGRALDVALAPSDFLVVGTLRGERYTRAGGIKTSPEGVLQVGTGDPVLGEDGKPIRVAPGATVTVDTDGTVRVQGATAGRLRVVTFPRPQGLLPDGATLLSQGEAGAPLLSSKALQVGVLEGSNASPIRAMTELMRATRLFEAYQRTIEAFHDADRKAASEVSAR